MCRHQKRAAFAALEQLVLNQVVSLGESIQKGATANLQLSACVTNLTRSLTAGCESLLKVWTSVHAFKIVGWMP